MANSNAGSQGLLYAQIPPYYLSAPLNYHCLCPLLSQLQLVQETSLLMLLIGQN